MEPVEVQCPHCDTVVSMTELEMPCTGCGEVLALTEPEPRSQPDPLGGDLPAVAMVPAALGAGMVGGIWNWRHYWSWVMVKAVVFTLLLGYVLATGAVGGDIAILGIVVLVFVILIFVPWSLIRFVLRMAS